MTAAALHTSRMRLGMGTAVPLVRLAPTMAGGLASLNQLADDWANVIEGV